MSALTILQPVETKALWVRELARDDAAALARYMTRGVYQEFLAVRYPNQYAVRQFVTRAVARQGAAKRKAFHLAAQEKATGRIAGDGFIQFHQDRVAELGWGVDPERWGKGVGSQIAHALAAIAIERLGADDVWCKIMVGNEASLAVAANAGLRQDRVVQVASTRTGRRRDVIICRLKSNDYFESSY
jgi:RimJ/RimL family protein N-acetyltransferase